MLRCGFPIHIVYLGTLKIGVGECGPPQCDLPHFVVQDFNIEKLQLLESEKAKIRKEYERREGQIEVKKKMCAADPLRLHEAWLLSAVWQASHEDRSLIGSCLVQRVL